MVTTGSNRASMAVTPTRTPVVKPSCPTIQRRAGPTTTPPMLAPVKARLRARPRCHSNHGATRRLIAAPLIVDQPTPMTMNAA
jgi:hypothetical protein